MQHSLPSYRPPKDAGFLNRFTSLEARAVKRAKLGTQLYLPIIFIGYAVLLGQPKDKADNIYMKNLRYHFPTCYMPIL